MKDRDFGYLAIGICLLLCVIFYALPCSIVQPDCPDAPVVVECPEYEALDVWANRAINCEGMRRIDADSIATLKGHIEWLWELKIQMNLYDIIENDTIPLVRSDPYDDHYHRIGMAKLTSPPRYGPMPGTKKPSHPDPCVGMVSIEAVEALLAYYIDLKPTVYGGSDWDGTGPPYLPDTSVVTIDYLEWQRIKEGR